MQEREDHGGEWTGDVWKAIAYLRMNNANYDIRVVDTDYGCGLIKWGTNDLFEPRIGLDDLDYKFFINNRKLLMNVISKEDFMLWINGQ